MEWATLLVLLALTARSGGDRAGPPIALPGRGWQECAATRLPPLQPGRLALRGGAEEGREKR